MQKLLLEKDMLMKLNEIAMKGTEGVLTLGDLKEVPVTVEAK